MDDYRRSIRIHCEFKNKEETSSEQRFLRPTYSANKYMPKQADQAVEKYLNSVEQSLAEQCDALFKKHTIHKIPHAAPRWLIHTLAELKANKDIIITNADKNMGIAIVRTTQYINEGLRQLQDETTYKRLEHPPDWTPIWDKARSILKQHGCYFRYNNTSCKVVSSLTQYILQLEGSPHLKLGSFYLLMKVHKTPVAGRPIVSSINSITYFASKYVDRMLQPLLKNIGSYLESSQHFISILHCMPALPPNCHLLCADITNLYPNIPIDIGLQYFKESILYYNQRTTIPANKVNLLCDLTRWILTNNYFQFGDRIYHQLQGTAMGTPVAVVFACLFIDYLERRTMHETKVRPLLYRRYIDDIFAVFASANDAEHFMQHFNSLLPSIKCTYNISAYRGEFLDCEVFKGEDFDRTGKLQTRLYQKPQNKYLYLPPSSFHSPYVFSAFITAEVKRYRILCSQDEDFRKATDLFFQRLVDRGYHPATLQPLFETEPDRLDLLRKIWERFTPRENRNMPSPTQPLIFKVRLTPETRALNITKHLQFANAVKDNDDLASRDLDFLIRQRKKPITCYMNSPSIATFFSKARRSLHGLSTEELDHSPSITL